MGNTVIEIKDKLNGPAEEAYNVLKTNILFYDPVKAIKTLAVTSYGPGEGKTTTAINLAVSLTRSGMKVLLVDADLRKPMMMKHLGSSNFKGLSNLLAGNAELEEVINETSLKGFYFIACGVKPVNPVEMFDSKRFDDFMETVRKEYDVVILDTPPLGSVIDGAVIAAKTDGTIMVIKSNVVKYRNALLVKEQLQKVNSRILGVVLNDINRNDYKEYYRNYDYYGNSRKYGKDWVKKPKGGE